MNPIIADVHWPSFWLGLTLLPAVTLALLVVTAAAEALAGEA